MGRLDLSRLNKNLLYWHNKPNEPTKEGHLSFVLFESPFTSILTVSRGHHSLVSLDSTVQEAHAPSTLSSLQLLEINYCTDFPSHVAKKGKRPEWYNNTSSWPCIVHANVLLFSTTQFLCLYVTLIFLLESKGRGNGGGGPGGTRAYF
jgi:hypothetical protein